MMARVLEVAPAFVGIAWLTVSAAIVAWTLSERMGFSRLINTAVHQLDLYATGIESELAKYESLPSMLELDEDIFAALRKPDDARLRARANRTLLNLNVRAGSLAIRLMDPQGIVLASSNWLESDNLVGRDLSHTEFYKQALRNGRARTFMAESTRGAPEYEFAHTMTRRGQVVDMVAVRVSLESIESTWIEYAAGSQSEKLLVIDDSGVIIMSSNPAWRYKTIEPLPAARRDALTREGRYSSARLEPLPLAAERPLEFGTRLVRLRGQDPQKDADPGELYIAEEQKMSRPGWRLMTLSSTTNVRRDALHNAIVGAAIGTLVGLLGYYLVQRRRVIAQLLSARADIQRANEELEVRVQSRTMELLEANEALVGEIAKHKLTERELRAAQDELVQSSRLAVLGQMSAGITHEINQPLQALRALSDNCRQLLKVGRTDGVDFNLGLIADLTDRMGRITKQLKAFARKGPVHHDSVRLVGAIANALELLSSRIRAAHVAVQVDVAENLRVACDGYRLEQVLLNLLSNALDAMKDEPLRTLGIHAEAAGDRVRVRITDTGTGLPDEVLDQLFKPFFSTKPPGEGLGLGLVISSSIVRETGGTLRGYNLPGGAAFEFDLQLKEESSHAISHV